MNISCFVAPRKVETFLIVFIVPLRTVLQRVGPLVEIANLVYFRLKLGVLKLLFARFVGYLCLTFLNIFLNTVGDLNIKFNV